MIENFISSDWQTQLSQREIQEMKKNMQKVPIIQAKSNEFHQKEALKAEIEFEEAQKNIKNTEEIIITENHEKEKLSRRKKIIKQLSSLLVGRKSSASQEEK